MARNLFGPMGAFSNSAPATTAPQTQSNQPKSSEPDVFGIARKYRIPPNIIIALQERGEDPEKAAQSIIAGLDAGKSFEDIVPKAVRIRASDIADEIEGITPEGGMGKALGVGIDVVQQGFGSALEGAGRSLGIDSLERYGARVAEDNAAEAASGARGLTGLGDVDGVGSAASYASETLAQQVPQLATSLGPVAAGAAIGSVVPGIGTALGAGVGLGVAGIGNIAQFYGMNRERQKEANPGEEVNELAAFGTAIPQAATDLASDVLIATPLGLGPKALQTGNMAMRALKGAGAGVAVEAPTEVLQQGMERAQAGLPIANADAGREYLESAVAGGLVGGTVGGVRGALSRPVEADVQPPAADPLAQTPAAPLALPAPTNGGTLFLPNPGGDGSAAGQNAAPNMAPPGGIGAAFDEPEGPLTRAAKSAPDMTPQAAPAPLFPDMKPGAKIVLADPETGELVDATFQREENGVPIVRINGQEQPVPPEIFDIAMNEGMKAMESAKGAKGSLAAAAKPKAPRPQAPEPELDDLPLEQAIARLNDVNDRIRVMARPSKKVLETRDKLTEIIARKQGEANAQGATDGTPPTDGMAGGQSLGTIPRSDAAGSGPDQVAPVQTAPVSPAPVGSGGEGLAGATGGTEQGEALTPSPVEQPGSWIVKNKETGEAVTELFDPKQVEALNTAKYEAVPAKEYLEGLNAPQAEKPRAPVAPITTPPSERMQPDLLGGQAVSEEDMAAKERRRREWGRYLAIAEGGKSNDDMQLEGRDILIRPGFTVIRAKNGQRSDLDYRLDTNGMSRDDIAAAMRGALRELDRVSPLPAPEPARPVAAQIAEAAASAEPNPTEAQKEAGNYRKGHQNWRGLGLTFETAEGETRTGKGPDGKEWSVKMPAHYGYLKRTEGADGENLDFYMGPNTDSDSVFVVDQVDAETGRFDEHKIIFGTDNQLQAAELYAAGFSDGKGPQRMGAITQLTMEQFKNALRNADWQLPTSIAGQDTGRGPVYASGFLDRFRGKLREAPSYLKNGKAKRTWEEGWTAANKHPMAPALPGSEAATGPSTLQIKNLRTGKTSEIEGQSSQPTAPQKGGWKQIGTNARGKPLLEDERGVRAYSEGGIRVSESVGVVPGGGITIDKDKRGRDYLTQEEWDAKNPPQSAPTGPRILVNVVGPDGLTDAERKAGKEPYNKPTKAERIEEEAEKAVAYLTQQIDREKNKARDARSGGNSSKAAIHDANLRRMRMNIWKAEAAIKEALQQGQFAPFAASEADFPLAAAQLRSAIGRIAPMEDDTAPASPATPDGSAFEAVGMVKGKSTAEDAWFRKQAEQGGVATYKARAVASGWKLTRDFQPGNDVTAPPTRQLGTVATTADAIAQLRENGMRTGVPEEADTGPAQTPKQPAPAAKPAQTGILSALSEEKQKRVAELQAMLAAKVRNQTSSGVDPEYLTLGGELVALYVEAGVKKFGQMLRDFAASTGLSMREAQAPMRVAYNHVRDTMDLDGEDISEFDTADQVMSEIRAAIAEESAAQTGESPVSPQAEDGGNVAPDPNTTEGGTNELPARTDRTGELGEGGKREDGGRKPLQSGQSDGNRDEGDVAGEQAGPVSGNAGTGRTRRSGARSALANDRTGEADGARGLESIGRMDGSLPRTDDAGRLTAKGRSNYVISDPEALFGGTPKKRFAKNKAAIEAFQRVTEQNREPTQEELDAMASYIGWGSFGQELFQGTWERPIYRDGWREENDWLRAHLGPEEWKAAQNSIINAHYTDPPTVQAMWRMAEQMGFKGGRVLEPSMGIGNFFGMMPQHIAKNSDLTGIELDRLTGGMAKLLYPRANVQIMGYEQSKTPDNFYDLVIGNWPFADFEVPDRRYMKLQPNLHDYFFVKALDQVRPGGLVMGITSAGTMDKQGRVIRNHLAKNAELVASFRLPSGAFEQYAGTKVVTDLIVLRKREAPVLDVSDAGWTQTQMIDTPAGTEIRVNEYYAKDRFKVLGTLNYGSGTTYGRAAMIVDRPADLMQRLEKLHEQLPRDAYTPIVRGNEPRFIANNTTDPQRSLVERDGELYQVLGDRLVKLEDLVNYRVKDQKKAAEREAQFRGVIDLRKKMGAVLDADRDGLEDADTKRAALKKAYQAFVKAHGPIRQSYAIDIMHRVLKDPGAAKVKALETPDGKPAAIMERATTRAIRSLDNPTISDAFILARNESTIIDLDRVANLANRPKDEVTASLLESKAIYRTPGGGFEASDVYLSGNVRQKLKDALAAKEAGEDMDASIEALRGVVPPDVPYFNIEAKLGAMWIPSDVYRAYLGERFGLPERAQEDINIRYSAGAWRVEFPSGFDSRAEVQAITGGDVRAKQFISYALNNQTITVKRRDSEGNEYKDEAASERANQLASELRQNFSEWVWKEPERRSNLESAYNDAMNAIATPSYDGSFMDFAGMSLTRGDKPFNLRAHQSNAIWRGVLNGRGIYAHEVGTGKTITMAGLAVESRRYGVARKPLIIAHNANSRSVFNEIQETYPGGKFLYVDNLAPDEIDATLNMIATDDWDGIVIPHSLIDRMALKEETLMAMAADEIAQYEQEALSAAREDDASLTLDMMDDEDAMKKVRSVTAKQLVKARNQIIAKIKKQALQSSKENAVTFEDLGIDMVIVDEAHEFKKPPVATRMTVRGLQKQVSSRSLQLRFLTDYVKGNRGGKGVHVFTGTPITNTLTEIYHQMRYVMDDVMRQSDVNEWDGFFNTFAASVPDVELTAAGDYESVERLSAFVNVAELRRMAGQYMDIVFADDMPEFKPRPTKSGKTAESKDLTDEERDELLNGRMEQPEGRPYKKVIHDIAEMDPYQRAVLEEQVGYARSFRAADGKTRMAIMRRGGPDAPIVFNAVPTRAGLDVRLHQNDAPDNPNSKASRAVRNVARIYREDPRTTQVIFMDEGYSDSSTKAVKNADGEKIGTQKIERFNLAKDIRDRLISEGISPDQIAIVDGGVSKEKRAEIAQKMNRLEIRVVIGLTQTLGVGVNMQENLRAMHHLDAPWMPGDLEQRNGRGHRQGNKWNTVLEYRYLTEGLDGRRWQVLSIKDRFIKAFLKADANLRVIEGDATDDATSMSADDLAQTLSEAAGDPRIFQVKKLEKDIERLQRRERIHGEGIVDAKRSIRRLESLIPASEQRLENLRRDLAKFEAAREAGFSATINGKAYDEREAAQAAFDAVVVKMKTTDREKFNYRDWLNIGVTVQGFDIKAKRASYDDFYFAIDHEGWNEIDTLGKPSIASVESGLRRFASGIERVEAQIAQDRASIARLNVAMEQPFQQAGALAAKRTQLADIQADMKANPVAPPSWLRQGAPIDSLVYVDGKPRAVTGHRWTDEGWFVLTEQGPVDYLAATDESGIAVFDERPFRAPEVNEGAKLRTGDDAAAMEMREDRAPVATLTGDELGRKAEAWYRDNLLGQSVVNEASGMKIRFTKAGAKKLSGRKGDVLYRVVPALRDVIAKGVVTSVSPETKGRQNIKAWHAISAAVIVDGKPRDVIAHVMETTDGNFHYDLSRDMSDGARFMREGADTSITDSRYGVEDSPVDLNLEFAPASRKEDAAIGGDDLRVMARDLNAMPEIAAMGGRVPVRVVSDLVSHVTGNPILGRFNAGRSDIEVRAGGDAKGVMRHEVIHALRSERLWGKPFGLFTAPEWRELARMAKQQPEIVASVRKRYAEKPPEVQTEEMVAELYRLWAANRDGYGAVERALLKIEGFLTALANALRGRGFVSAARTMDQIASGRIGGRGPEGPGGGRRGRDAEMRPEGGQPLLSGAVLGQVRADLQTAGRVDPAYPLARIPEVLARLGIENAPLVVRKSVLNKAMGKHQLSLDEAVRAIEGLANPVMVFDSETVSGAFVSLVDVGNDKSVVVAVHPDGEVGRMAVSYVASIHKKDNPSAVLRWVNDGLVRYMNKESAGAWFQSRRLQLPREGIKHQRGIRILQHRDVFKDDDAGGMEMRALPGTVRAKFDGLIGFNHWRKPGEFVSDVLTDAMANGRWSLLGLVPGRPLFTELGKKLPSAQKFVDSKQQMDAERNEWHVRAAAVIDKWTSAHRKMPAEIQKMHDLMFRVTISGVDPTRPDEWEAKNPDIAKAREEVEKKGDRASAKAKRRVAEADNRAKSYDIMRAEFAALPQEAQDIFKSALQELVDLDKAGLDALEKSIKDNAGLALKRAEREYRKDMARIRDQGLEGDDLAEAEDKARTRLEKARARFSAGEMGETLQSLRKQFESARLQGPYFPLFRSGKYFVAARDTDGVMVSFQMMDSVQKQRAAAAQLAEAFPAAKVTSGLSADRDSLREVVDPRFVADVESLLADSGASEGLMDAVWQRYLQTMPEQSLRTSALHRKAVPGYNQDALRAFAHHMFHGAHQTMRLKYAAELETSIIDAMDQAALADDRNRAEAVVQEMARRKDWVLAPQNAPWVSWASGLTFLWYLGVSPAAALVNISQTTIMGPAIIKAKFRGVTVSRALRELTRASNDFARGQGVSWKDTWSAENAPGLTEDERAAIREGYRQGTIDKTQSHDTTSVAESGVEYNSAREKIMRAIGFFYHHAERFNREVTFLAAYRLARDEGLDFTAATEKAKAVTWDTHFSYVNSDRPRFMQGDIEKVIFTFRQFSVNLIWRLWRDTHQSFNGSTPEERAEARTQVIGITLSMFAHAGIKGVWGYGMLMALMALFLPGDREDHEEWLEKALIKEGDDIGTAAWNFAMGSVLNGVPGQLTGIALSERIGSPDLWFRTPDSDLEGQDLAMHYLRGLAGPTFGIGEGLFRAASFAGQGELVRGVEAATPKFLRDLIRTGRFATEGVTTIKGDDILESMSPWELAMQANGFTPARLDAAYQDRGYLYLVQDRIESERRKIHRAATDALSDGKPIPPEVLEQVNDFNRRYPFFAINGESIRRSYRARIQSAERTVGGANLNPKLDTYLRELLAPGYR